MSWSRPVLCLAAFALTLLLTSLVIYHADIGFYKWSPSSNQTASQEKLIAFKPTDESLQAQEMSAGLIMIQPRLLPCQCQFCHVPPTPPVVRKRVLAIVRPSTFSSPFSHMGTSRFINLLHPNFDHTSSESETAAVFRQPRIETRHTFHFIRPQAVSPFNMGSDLIKSLTPKEEQTDQPSPVLDSEERVAEMLLEQIQNMMNMDQPNRVDQKSSDMIQPGNEVSAHMLAIIQRDNSETDNDFQNKQEPSMLDEKELENTLREMFQIEDESKSEPDIPDKIRIEDTSKFLDSTTLLNQLIDFENQDKSKSDESSPHIHEFSYQTFGKNGNQKNFGWTRTYKLRQGEDDEIKNIRPKTIKPKKTNKKPKNNNKNRARQARRNQQKKQEGNRCRCRSVCRVSCPQKQVDNELNQVDNEIHPLN